jgi:phage terminase small subunit
MTTSYTLEQVQALEAALAQGVQTVEYDNQRITYRSASEMRRQLAEMKRSLGLTPRRDRRAIAEFDRGL